MSNQLKSSREDIYTRITKEIVEAMEYGPSEFAMPWHHDGSPIVRPINVASGKPYRGVNILALWAAGVGLGFGSGLWGTYKQWSERGAQVRKGACASTVIFWKSADSPSAANEADEGDEKRRGRVIARGYSVFNADQVEGFELPETPILPESERDANADAFLAALGIDIAAGGAEAYYTPSTDTVHLPDFERFRDAASFYAVAIHECGHATGAKHRLDRNLMSRFGTQTYAAEEICVELAAGFVLAELGIAHHPRPDHAAYISSWIDLLKDDRRAIFTAASKAQQIADWMHAQQVG
ncbi:MAG: zincin-like metallopeptidase domain-containing protein [Caulobacterales bacterium]